jgi:hypothetical protein
MEKYGSMEGGWMTKIPTRPYGVGLWKFIQSGWNTFARFLSFEVGDGSRIRFWNDVWCGVVGILLRKLFRSCIVLLR